MSTTTGPDLTPARLAVERLMDDTCEIRRNVDGVDDAVLNQATGLLEDPTPLEPFYTGPCSLRMSAQGVASTIAVPLAAPELLPGDVVKMTSTRRDPVLVGEAYVIKKPLYNSMAVSRRAVLREPDEVISAEVEE